MPHTPSEFVIQVVHKDTGRVVEWAPGLAVEKEFDQELLNRLRSKGVGWFKSEEKVLTAVHEALRALLYELKAQV